MDTTSGSRTRPTRIDGRGERDSLFDDAAHIDQEHGEEPIRETDRRTHGERCE